MNYEQARRNMIEQQLRPWDVLDAGVVDLLYADRRENFVPAAQRALAFADIALPLSPTAAMLPPKLEAHAIQALALKPHERALEIGTGSGHMAALLASRVKEVWSVEIDPQLAATARANLANAGIDNVQVEVGDGLAAGLVAQAPFDVIVLSGGVREVPTALTDQLAAGGRLLAFVALAGQEPLLAMRLTTRTAADVMTSADLMETVVPMLQQPAAPRFVF
jgi:protein-L-isoaspartate(D-aspartate) O-methyltransferase